LLIAVPVLAAYTADIQLIESNGTDYTMFPVRVALGTTYLVANGFITATGLDTRVEVGGVDQPHLLADDKLLFAYPVPGGTSQDLDFTTGNAALVNYDITLGFGGYITMADAAALEPGDDFQFDNSGFVDTGAGTNKNILFKRGAYWSRISAAGTVTSSIMGAFTWTVPTGAVDGGGTWNNEANAWDNNTATFSDSDAFSGAGVWSDYLELTHASLWTDRIRYWVTVGDVSVNVLDLDAFYSGGWNDVFQGAFATGAYETQTMANWQQVTALRIRFQDSDGGAQVANIHEAHFAEDAAQVTVTQAALTSGEAIVRTLADTVNLELYIDGALQDTAALGGASVPDNNEDWTIGETNVLPYADYYQHTVGGTLIVWYQPNDIIATTVMPDREGAAQNGVITWGTNPGTVAVTIGSLVATDEPVPSTVGRTTTPDAAGEINQPSNMFPTDVEMEVTDSFLYPFINTFATMSNTPIQLMWWFLYAITMMVAMALTYKYLKHLFLAGFAALIVTGFFVAMGAVPWWLFIPDILFILGAATMERSPSL